MSDFNRRQVLHGSLAAGALALSPSALATGPAFAQTGPLEPRRARFGFDDVTARARELSQAPYQEISSNLPEAIAKMDWDAWRNIRFRGEKALSPSANSPYKVQTFHLGHLFKRPVTVSLIRNNIAVPIPYSPDLFDYGPVKLTKTLPVDLGFAGFRIHYPLNGPHQSDELVSFVGSSYFRWLGRDQKYGLSARGLAINSGLLDNKEEFPFFREFWIDDHGGQAGYVTIYALLDSPSITGGYKFDLWPGRDSRMDVRATVFPRKPIRRLGIAPLTSMYFLGENDRHMNDRNKYDEFRPELHDSDGLLMHTAKDKWIWRPLKNPQIQEVQLFDGTGIKGFGLMQRDRNFSNYQDIELNYEERPSYWIEPTSDWGQGKIELIELATRDETADNIVCAFVPDTSPEPGKPFSFSYRMYSKEAGLDLHDLGYVLNTFSAPPKALGSNEAELKNTRRMIIDFAGGNMAYYVRDPNLVKVQASAQNAKVLRSFIAANPAVKGLRVMADVQYEPDKIGKVELFLQHGPKVLTETWSYAWRFYDL